MKLAPIVSYHDEDDLTDYELARLAAIKANTELLLSLGLPPPSINVTPVKSSKKRERIDSDQGSPQASSLEVFPLLTPGKGVRPGRRYREESLGRGAFDGVHLPSFPTSPTPRRRGFSYTYAASESPSPSSPLVSPSAKRLRGRRQSAPVETLPPSRGERRSTRNRVPPSNQPISLAAQTIAVVPCYSQQNFLVADSDLVNAEEESEGALTFYSQVLPRLVTTTAACSPQTRRGRSCKNSSSKPSSKPVLTLGPILTSRIYSPKRFGPIPNVPIGSWFPTRLACSTAALHAPTVAGISGNSHSGAYSLCLSGGYEDDSDLGASVTFTGSGGRDLRGTPAHRKNLRTAPQSKDQDFENPLNAAMKKSMQTKRPIRVVRGFKGRKPFAPPEGYVYCGLYTVQRCWLQRGQSGFMVCRFQLERCEGQAELPTFMEEEQEEVERMQE